MCVAGAVVPAAGGAGGEDDEGLCVCLLVDVVWLGYGKIRNEAPHPWITM